MLTTDVLIVGAGPVGLTLAPDLGRRRTGLYTVAVRTGGEGMSGISLLQLLLERGMPGFTQTRLDKMGWHCSDTAALNFDNVEVPAENLIGPQNGSFMRIPENFNSERLYREVRVVAIGGGSEEILLELAGRQLGYC